LEPPAGRAGCGLRRPMPSRSAADLRLPHSLFCLLHSALKQAPPVFAQDWPKTRNHSKKMPVDSSAPLCQYRLMLGEPGNQFFLTRVAPSTSGRAKNQFLISISSVEAPLISDGQGPGSAHGEGRTGPSNDGLALRLRRDGGRTQVFLVRRLNNERRVG